MNKPKQNAHLTEINVTMQKTIIELERPFVFRFFFRFLTFFYTFGGARRDRTADLLRAKQALSQLSYGP